MTAPFAVIAGSGTPAEQSEELADKLKALVYAYEGKLSLSAAIGVLEIVKYEIIQEHR